MWDYELHVKLRLSLCVEWLQTQRALESHPLLWGLVTEVQGSWVPVHSYVSISDRSSVFCALYCTASTEPRITQTWVRTNSSLVNQTKLASIKQSALVQLVPISPRPTCTRDTRHTSCHLFRLRVKWRGTGSPCCHHCTFREKRLRKKGSKNNTKQGKGLE